jgi:hypothetical protein
MSGVTDAMVVPAGAALGAEEVPGAGDVLGAGAALGAPDVPAAGAAGDGLEATDLWLS